MILTVVEDLIFLSKIQETGKALSIEVRGWRRAKLCVDVDKRVAQSLAAQRLCGTDS